MKILFEIGLPSHIRHYDNVVETLKQRGHKVRVACTLENRRLYRKRNIDHDHRNVTANVVFTAMDPWSDLAYILRCGRDFIHYLRPEYDQSKVLRGRIRNMLHFGLPENFLELGKVIEDFAESLPRKNLEKFYELLGLLDQVLPDSSRIEKYLRKINPDLFLITPLIFTQYGQFEMVKCAQKLGIPVGYMVFSWDNITTKGVIQQNPDAIFMWNEVQWQELSRFYNFDPKKMYLCGAPRFDYFFEKKPSLSREEYCKSIGLDSSKNYILYLCSSNLVSETENEFVQQWLESIDRSLDRNVQDCNVLIRPHPKFRKQWETFTPSVKRQVVVRSSENMNNDQGLFNALYYCSAVVGLNTSAQLEAAVLRKPVLTIYVSEFIDGQQGTLHFHYLLEKNGGFVRKSESFEEHIDQLAEVLSEKYDLSKIDKFVEMFIRPKGRDKSAAVATAEAIETFSHSISSGMVDG